MPARREIGGDEQYTGSMSPRGSVAPYPWETLEAVSESTVRAIRSLSADLPDGVSLQALSAALMSLSSADVELIFKGYCDPGNLRHSMAALHFCVDNDSWRLSIEPEPQLADALVSRLLGRSGGITDTGLLSDAGIRGALARLCVEVARSSTPALILQAHSQPLEGPVNAELGIRATLILEGRPYALRASVARVRPRQRHAERADLHALGPVPLSIPLLGAVCCADQATLLGLGEGDAFMPGAAWWLGTDLSGTLAIGPEASGRAVFFEIIGPRSAKLVGVKNLPLVEEDLMPENPEGDLSQSIAETLLDAPLIVRVEVASLSMSAAEFAALRPGDVIETDQALGQLCTLRVAGREVAKGELVNVDGELGVRIRKIIRGD
jgi:flagellar motor switch/type III secretory pathway protein FliN